MEFLSAANSLKTANGMQNIIWTDCNFPQCQFQMHLKRFIKCTASKIITDTGTTNYHVQNQYKRRIQGQTVSHVKHIPAD